METINAKYTYITNQGVSSVAELASLIEKDMQYKGLVPGDRYLYTEEVAEQFNVNKMLAHRAMKLLADKEILIRQQRSGTFVGESFEPLTPREEKGLKSVHIMISMDYHRSSGLREDILVDAALDVIPDVGVHLHYVPERDPLNYTKNIINQSKQMGEKEGFIFIRSTFEVQRYLQDNNVLAVIFGSVYSGIDRLPWLDVDQGQIGRLMAEYAIGKGCKSFAVLMYNTWRHGDSVFFNSITQNLGKIDFNMNSLSVYNVGKNSDIPSHVHSMLAAQTKPLAIFCRTDNYAESVLEIIQRQGLVLGRDVVVISGGHAREGNGKWYPHIKSKVDIKTQAKQMVEMLCKMASSDESNEESVQVSIPADLVENQYPIEAVWS